VGAPKGTAVQISMERGGRGDEMRCDDVFVNKLLHFQYSFFLFVFLIGLRPLYLIWRPP
jgi:hypothetical protein